MLLPCLLPQAMREKRCAMPTSEYQLPYLFSPLVSLPGVHGGALPRLPLHYSHFPTRCAVVLRNVSLYWRLPPRVLSGHFDFSRRVPGLVPTIFLSPFEFFRKITSVSVVTCCACGLSGLRATRMDVRTTALEAFMAVLDVYICFNSLCLVACWCCCARRRSPLV